MNQENNSNATNAPIIGLDEEKYRGQWLVINGTSGQIIGNGNHLKDVQKEAIEQAIKSPAFYKVPSTDTHYISIK